jgi:hypothetical protein
VGLNELNLRNCVRITDTSLIKITENLTNLQDLNLSFCHKITDIGVIKISVKLVGLNKLYLCNCDSFGPKLDVSPLSVDIIVEKLLDIINLLSILYLYICFKILCLFVINNDLNIIFNATKNYLNKFIAKKIFVYT